jgi:hypothetical protein
MTLRRPVFFLLPAVLLGAFLAGCTTAPATDHSAVSNLPQARPASWQGGIPGLSNMTGSSGSPTGGNGLR